jgi:drug/metabolite transporter (DMT)-like permease
MSRKDPAAGGPPDNASDRERFGGAAKGAYLLLSTAAAIWAGNALAGRLAVGEISPMALTCLRWIIAFAGLALLARADLARDAATLKRHWLYVLLVGSGGYTVFTAFFYAAAYHTTAVNMAILQGAIPVLVLIGALVAFRTRIGGLQGLGAAITLAGVVLVASKGDAGVLTSLAFNIGDVWMLAACLAYALYTLALRERPPVSTLSMIAAFAGAAFLTSLPLLAYEVATGTVQWPTGRGLVIVGFVGLFPSLVAQLSYLRGVELIGPGRAGIFVNLVPVLGALGAVALLGEPFGAYHAVALALVLGGIWLAERYPPAT